MSTELVINLGCALFLRLIVKCYSQRKQHSVPSLTLLSDPMVP